MFCFHSKQKLTPINSRFKLCSAFYGPQHHPLQKCWDKTILLSTTTSMFPALLHPKNLLYSALVELIWYRVYITHLIDIGKEKGARERAREREREDGALCGRVR
jgi:hypothetical protein